MASLFLQCSIYPAGSVLPTQAVNLGSASSMCYSTSIRAGQQQTSSLRDPTHTTELLRHKPTGTNKNACVPGTQIGRKHTLSRLRRNNKGRHLRTHGNSSMAETV